MDEELNPQQAERVRRLLAEARHTEPMPDDVVARLDRVLADLAADPGSPRPADEPASGPAPVVHLAERRRRAGRLLLAAATVVVGGVVVAPLVSGGQNGASETSGSTFSDTDQGLEAPDRAEGQSEDEVADGAEQPGAISDSRQSISKLPAQRVRPEQFTTDARRLQPSAVAAREDAGAPSSDRGDALLSHVGDGCSPGVWGGGRYLRVAFAGEAGWLVYRAPQGDTQVVDLFLCGEDTAERSATLPYR